MVIFVVMENTDYTYLNLEPKMPGDPSPMFINSGEIFTLTVDGNMNVVCRWSKGKASALGVQRGVKINARSIVRLLRERDTLTDVAADDLFAIYRFKPLNTKIQPLDELHHTKAKALRTYTSTNSLADIISYRLDGGDANIAELIVAEATAVPVTTSEELPRLNDALMPYFEVATPQTQQTPKMNKEVLYGTSADDDPDEEDERYIYKEHHRRRRHNPLVTVILIIIALAAGWAAVNYLPQLLPTDTDYDTMESTDVTNLAIEEINDSITASSDTTNLEAVDTTAAISINDIANSDTTTAIINPAPKLELTPEEKADIKYLNVNRVWKRANLKSEKFIDFFDSFAKGDIKLLANSDYFAVEGMATNTNAVKAMDMLWRSLGSPTQASNVKVLRKLKGKKEIDMWKLQDTLARYRDKNYNKNPRPKKSKQQ